MHIYNSDLTAAASSFLVWDLWEFCPEWILLERLSRVVEIFLLLTLGLQYDLDDIIPDLADWDDLAVDMVAIMSDLGELKRLQWDVLGSDVESSLRESCATDAETGLLRVTMFKRT
mgnify:CR=1 FL=1